MQAAAQAAAQAAQEGAQTLLTKEVYRPGETGAGPSSGASPAGEVAEKPKFMKLPIQAAYRLKWYDSGKVADLIEQHLEEQRAVLGENKRLRGMLRARGASPEELEQGGGRGRQPRRQRTPRPRSSPWPPGRRSLGCARP